MELPNYTPCARDWIFSDVRRRLGDWRRSHADDVLLLGNCQYQ